MRMWRSMSCAFWRPDPRHGASRASRLTPTGDRPQKRAAAAPSPMRGSPSPGSRAATGHTRSPSGHRGAGVRHRGHVFRVTHPGEGAQATRSATGYRRARGRRGTGGRSTPLGVPGTKGMGVVRDPVHLRQRQRHHHRRQMRKQNPARIFRSHRPRAPRPRTSGQPGLASRNVCQNQLSGVVWSLGFQRSLQHPSVQGVAVSVSKGRPRPGPGAPLRAERSVTFDWWRKE